MPVHLILRVLNINKTLKCGNQWEKRFHHFGPGRKTFAFKLRQLLAGTKIWSAALSYSLAVVLLCCSLSLAMVSTVIFKPRLFLLSNLMFWSFHGNSSHFVSRCDILTRSFRDEGSNGSRKYGTANGKISYFLVGKSGVTFTCPSWFLRLNASPQSRQKAQ